MMKDSTRPNGSRSTQAIVLLHSSGLSSQQWRRLISSLGAHRTVAPDFLGCGTNPAWSSDCGDFELAMDLDPVRTILSGLDGPAHLVGHSYGAFIALTLARLLPSRVASLTLYEPTAFGVLTPWDDDEAVVSMMGLTQKLFLDESRPSPGSEGWFQVFCEYWAGQDIWRLMPQETKDSFLHAGRKVELEVKALVRDRTPLDEYRTVSVPTLLMCGGRSPAPTRRIASRLAGVMPHARLHELASAGHLGPITHARAVDKLIEEHLAGLITTGRA
ncbi:alpha/beta fold hydrolase [Sorangium sp. So ce1000]|uniref:alpha/beta fold hydrolase n=1 Tax=Sorangium sp. So ce1000 TaxID=3133325 RepID=UPI003F5DF2D8